MTRTKKLDPSDHAASRHGVALKPVVRLNHLQGRPDRGIQVHGDLELRELNARRRMQGQARLHRCDKCGLIDEWGDGWEWFGSLLEEDSGSVAKYCPDCHEPPPDATKRIIEKKRRA